MEKFKANSSVIDQVYYQENEDLIVKFNSGRFYRYKGVPREVFEAFAAAESKGIFFNNYIKNLYSYELDSNFQEPQAEPQPKIATTFAEMLAAAVLAKNEKNGGINAKIPNMESIAAIAAKGNVTPSIVKVGSETTIVIIVIN